MDWLFSKKTSGYLSPYYHGLYQIHIAMMNQLQKMDRKIYLLHRSSMAKEVDIKILPLTDLLSVGLYIYIFTYIYIPHVLLKRLVINSFSPA